MFKKILIANRGEIACRIIRTARRMGIATVAVYSDADRDALHVAMADEAIAIGPARAAESYLSPDRILAACQSSGAEAVHPGYGFLSENPSFARKVADEGFVFIGPPAAAIEAMGDKIASKQLAAAAGVRTVPGHAGVVLDADAAKAAAAAVGYPVMLKASAGGGGKGMRVAFSEEEVEENFRLAQSEARSAFADDRIFVERFIERPRHIEIQVLADAHGNVIHLGERECSIQRRHQKIIEEAPSPFLQPSTRAAMGEQAVSLARAVGYRSAGTVEFIVDPEACFYFLEMNTRLQVEHPVTELVTGLDLVEAMIRIAAGEPLDLGQDNVRLHGWAIECRIYAENSFRGFLPSTGRLTHYAPPRQGEEAGVTVRVDTGVVEGSQITPFYDPMIAKLCVHAPTRAAAIEGMSEALDEYAIEGVRQNIPFVSALMAHPRFREGRLATDFIAQEYPDGFFGGAAGEHGKHAAVAIVLTAHLLERDRICRRAGAAAGRGLPSEWVVLLGREPVPVQIVSASLEPTVDTELRLAGGPILRVATTWRPHHRIWHGEVDGKSVTAKLDRRGHAMSVERGGVTWTTRVLSPRAAELARLLPERIDRGVEKAVRSPMPGVILSISVVQGQKVELGEALAVVEAMKMENVLRAERAGTIASIHAAPGQSIAVDAAIMEFA